MALTALKAERGLASEDDLAAAQYSRAKAGKPWPATTRFTPRADLPRRAGRRAEALAAYRRACELANPEVERDFFRTRMAELQ